MPRDDASPWTTTETWTGGKSEETELLNPPSGGSAVTQPATYDLIVERKRIDALAARMARAESEMRPGPVEDLPLADTPLEVIGLQINNLVRRVARLEERPEDERVPLLDRIKGLEQRVLSLELDDGLVSAERMPDEPAKKPLLQRVCEKLGIEPDTCWSAQDWIDAASGENGWANERDALLWRIVEAMAERGYPVSVTDTWAATSGVHWHYGEGATMANTVLFASAMALGIEEE